MRARQDTCAGPAPAITTRPAEAQRRWMVVPHMHGWVAFADPSQTGLVSDGRQSGR
jgi:hypothetical protein